MANSTGTSILDKVGDFFKRVFESKANQEILQIGTAFAGSPVASLLMGPAGAALLQKTLSAVENVELGAIAIGQQAGTGATKAALVAQTIEADYNTFAATNGLPVTPASLQAYINAAVALAQSFPAPTVPAATPAPATPAA
jgi:hypothetical protein